MSRSSHALICMGLATVAACRPAPTDASENIPFKILAVAGNAQSGLVNSELPNWIRFLVTDPSGRPVAGVHVQLNADEDEGSTPVTEMITDENGSINTHWTLGPVNGTQTLVAKVVYLEPATVTATATGCDLPECPEYELVEDQETVLQLATYDLTGQVVHPDVVRRTSSTGRTWYWLAITPYPNNNALYENPSIYRGSNGRYWRVPKGVLNPVVRPVLGFNSDPDMVVDKSTNAFMLYYRLVALEQNIIMRTQSPDGITWSASDTVLKVPSHRAVSPAIVNDGPHAPFQMWTVNTGSDGCVASSSTVERRTSNEGMTWAAPITTNLQQPGKVIWHIDVRWVPARSEYWAIYTTFEPGMNCATTALYLARSPDGVTWQIPKSPIYRAGTNPFFKDVVYRSSFLTSDDGLTATFWLSGANLDLAGNLIWSAATSRRKTSDLLRISDTPSQSSSFGALAHLLPVPEPWDMPRQP